MKGSLRMPRTGFRFEDLTTLAGLSQDEFLDSYPYPFLLQVPVEKTESAKLLGDELKSNTQWVAPQEILRLVRSRTKGDFRKVVVNERAGVITITGDVEIAPVAIAHRNIVVETGGVGTGSFVALDPADPQNPKLKSLVTSLNAINVPTSDIIEIIKLVNANGALAGDLILK